MFPYSTILNPIFWILMGVLYTVFVISIRYWAKDFGLNMTITKWIVSAFWFLFLNLTIAGAFTLFGEDEQRAGFYFLGFFGVITIIFGVGLWRWVISGRKE